MIRSKVATGVRVLVNGTAALLCEKPACANWKFPSLFPDCVRTEYCQRNQFVMAISEKTDTRRKKKRRKSPAGRRTSRPKYLLNCCQAAVKFDKAVRTVFLQTGQGAVGGYTFLKGSSEFLLVSGIDKFWIRRKGHYVYRTIFSRVRCDLPVLLDQLIRR
uniref:Uncharacterized protein n=1 Tax=Plectus sambesii TaxID=2011161 RepID=A0A914WRY3_9BILA